ncbi:hypothetical protein AWB78_04913 [Caballeronia calidae]|uniref:Uncharacterized protein n=1 Tax=Caballeronia calidae TaxID=1777139 RepID=A0A158D9L4_9BURK|nr:hypothetical protein [Caballeronia calidae]SAK91345.1 hypothetical protein AWB78_04913 [Caballeronia calidae]
MDLEHFEEVRPPVGLARQENWFVSALDGLVSTHPTYRLVTVWRSDCKCLALNFVRNGSAGVYTCVHRLAYRKKAPSMLMTDRSALCGALVTVASSLPQMASVAWCAPLQELRAAMNDLVNIGRRLSASHRFSVETIQSVFDGWLERFNLALDGYVSPELLEEGRVRPDWFEMFIEGLQSNSASMALSTLHTHLSSAHAHASERQTTAGQRCEHQDSEEATESSKRPRSASRVVPIRSRLAEEVSKSVRLSKA